MKRVCICVLGSLAVLFFLFSGSARADERATLTGYVTDPGGARVPGARVQAINVATSISYNGESNDEGLYRIVGIPTGTYRVSVQKQGFKTTFKDDVALHVLDTVSLNFLLQLGSVTESVSVTADATDINTESASVSTLVDRQLAENIPMNGRSFQTLIQLTPGVTLTPQTGGDSGQFSVNGQRASSNYWTLDGVSANIGIAAAAGTPGNGLAGTVGSFSTMGGTNSLVSVDALQEFRIETSTYAPEFGRTPGGQISIVTRSGTNQFHGTAFDFVRNDKFDANDWFANSNGAPRSEERQNDFGGTLGGPILKGSTFFFFSYEGLRLRLPQFSQTLVPATSARQNANSVMQPYLNAFPLPSGPEIFIPCDPTVPPCPLTGLQPTGNAPFKSGYSDQSTLNAYSLRIDHKLTNKLGLFARYDYSPSKSIQRGVGLGTLSTVTTTDDKTQTGTVGALWSVTTQAANDLRFNYSSMIGESHASMDSFGGAAPLSALPFPSPYNNQDGRLAFTISSLATNNGLDNTLLTGKLGHNHQQQYNLVDTFSWQKGSHAIKLGVDYRRLSPQFNPFAYGITSYISDVPSAETGSPALSSSYILNFVYSSTHADLLFRNLGVFAEDTWRITPRFTLTYGLRWDVDFVPSSLNGPALNALTGFNLNDLSNLALAPAGTTPYKTKYGNVAPRVGLAYQVSQSSDWQTVLRAGFGVFYDLASAEAGNNVSPGQYPFGGQTFSSGSFPPDNTPPAIVPPDPSNLEVLYGFDPNLRLPYTLQWSAAVEQGLGKSQSITASYIGSVGRRLIQTANISSPPSGIFGAQLVTNDGTSSYNSLQIQFQRKMAHGLQALGSYVWAHSIDTASASSVGNGSNALIGLDPNVNRGPSDFDVRNAFSAALTYDVPSHEKNAFVRAILGGWSTENVIQARSSLPVDLYDSSFGQLSNGFLTNNRPDLVAGQPLYLFGPQYPGGKAFNPGAFMTAPIDPVTFYPTRQGNFGRNVLRGFGAAQWDFGVHRDFPIRESIKLQFRGELFNLLNHPNFGPPVADLSSSQFGLSTQMLGRSLAGNSGAGQGGFDPLYQIGGPRSVQLALKLFF